ncbi:MAG TPA: crossover junction endodeoxyribonuclease RuvC [Anaeromyxobacteraceae bacterium]|nr:crossover junction endodeoxyribonuclease RuvC [Anaeromyxobacteraceae bacterium]
MIVLGIDPGSHRCGYGVVARDGSRLQVVESGVLVPGTLPMADRLGRILVGLEAVIARARPGEVSVEQVFSGASARSALVLGQARGVALAAAARAGLPVFEYAPSEVKLAFTGSGRASKGQMVRTARALLGVEAELADEADAIALAVCHLAKRTARLAVAATARNDVLGRLRPARRVHRRSP